MVSTCNPTDSESILPDQQEAIHSTCIVQSPGPAKAYDHQKSKETDNNMCTCSSLSYFNIVGVDEDAFTYENDFELDNGLKLQNENLNKHLESTCKKLSSKVKYYRHQCEELEQRIFKMEHKYQKSITDIWTFYRDFLYYGQGRSSKMVRLALQQNK